MITTLGHFQLMKNAHLHSRVSCIRVLISFCFAASSSTNEVELFDFETNKWESKPELSYPFNGGKGWVTHKNFLSLIVYQTKSGPLTHSLWFIVYMQYVVLTLWALQSSVYVRLLILDIEATTKCIGDAWKFCHYIRWACTPIGWNKNNRKGYIISTINYSKFYKKGMRTLLPRYLYFKPV